ncbi:MAG: hypothetical protein AABN33_18210 [Acidobacteriota bacterium]
MRSAIVQRQIVETARARGFTERHIARMSFEIGHSITVGGLSSRQMDTLLDALKREKPEPELSWAENLIDLMCKCQDGVFKPIEAHKPTCAFRRVIELTEG